MSHPLTNVWLRYFHLPTTPLRCNKSCPSFVQRLAGGVIKTINVQLAAECCTVEVSLGGGRLEGIVQMYVLTSVRVCLFAQTNDKAAL